MILDLHTHYPMHIAAGDWEANPDLAHPGGASAQDSFRAKVLRLACRLDNYQGDHGGPAVTLESLKESSVGAILSVLYVPLDEMDFSVAYGAPPRPAYISDLIQLMDAVETSLVGQTKVVLARNPAELDAAKANGKIALVHAVEGGFHFGDSKESIQANVAQIAQRGVAYVTIAHLFWRGVATNAPAIPFLSDHNYATIFPQPAKGLSALGRIVVESLVANGILIDLTHMSSQSFMDTMTVLEEVDPDQHVPVIASHGAIRFGDLEYNLTAWQVKAIAARKGVIGLIACSHYIAEGIHVPASFDESVAALCRHIDRIHEITGSHDFTAIGSDQDGFIKPALIGLESPSGLGSLEHALAGRYDAETAAKICWGNARRVLGSWTVQQ